MSILIITNPRTGSTILTKSLALALGYREVHEPLNPVLKKARNIGALARHLDYSDIDFDSITPDDKLVVKCMTHQFPEQSNTIEYFSKLAKQFNDVIILDRIDIDEQSKSYAIAAERTRLSQRNDFATPYSSDYKVSKELIQSKIEFYLNEKPKLELLSIDLNIRPIYYEHLYSDKKTGRLHQINHIVEKYENFNQQTYLKWTDPKRRLKKDIGKRNLL